ncbi:PilX N-terminal domain-containing pilus assembly protein [Nitrosomonas sp. Is37]|uniref:pilus assembly PilX family protein n=1 Tax=Nitrosomonas sp. Is37 TaxID=3080535 RepID=UPI00294B529D|nr:PilX N-terminal domain-containing pilus assembly protein [Nitrosomonas sp. Is37]MDV6344631.1 PilX N-terminal domain-containing pilus assembly protein [Nitrosomonas sp. Is37]
MIYQEAKLASRQRGVVLATGLIFLVMMTLLGVTAMQTTMLEEKMAGNLRDETLAFQAAEAALREGEMFLQQITLPAFDGSNGLYAETPADETQAAETQAAETQAPDPITWPGWSTSGRTIATTMSGVASQPRYIIEQRRIPVPAEKGGSVQQSATTMTSTMYRVIARGVGGTESAVVILQSDYRR